MFKIKPKLMPRDDENSPDNSRIDLMKTMQSAQNVFNTTQPLTTEESAITEHKPVPKNEKKPNVGL